MTSQLFPVSKSLQRDVIGIRVTQGTLEDTAIIKTCAMMSPGIVFQTGQYGPPIEKLVTRSAVYSPVPQLFIHGCRAEPSMMYFKKGAYTTLQIALQPWAIKTVLGLEASEIVTRSLSLDPFLTDKLEAKLIKATDTEKRLHILNAFLQNQINQHGQRDELVEESIDYINTHITSITVQSLLSQVGVTNRVLEKHFAQYIGYSPQKFIQVKRMNAALHLMWTGQYKKLTDVAQALNYYDQAHFIRDMKAFSWLAPKAITQSIRDFRQDESGIAYT